MTTLANAHFDINELLYPGCLTDKWQMTESERLGLTSILYRLCPRCAIEVGTYECGSLSLLAQFSTAVFSIDIDPSIPDRFRQFENVTFLTGSSQVVLPLVLEELDRASLPPDLVLIDGDHSAVGIKRDVEILLDYAPKEPMVVLMHDSFNPECRRGLLETDWQRSPFVEWVDIDFIPGRVIEHGGGGDGEMWGGFALARFSPARRQSSLVVQATAARAFAEMRSIHYPNDT
jgi:methyltransferase family protein